MRGEGEKGENKEGRVMGRRVVRGGKSEGWGGNEGGRSEGTYKGS